MNSFVYHSLLLLLSLNAVLSATIVQPNETAITAAPASEDESEEVFMVCSPMKSRQQLVHLLNQPTEQVREQLIASAVPTESPVARSNPEDDRMINDAVDRMLDIIHPGHSTSASVDTNGSTTASSSSGSMSTTVHPIVTSPIVPSTSSTLITNMMEHMPSDPMPMVGMLTMERVNGTDNDNSNATSGANATMTDVQLTSTTSASQVQTRSLSDDNATTNNQKGRQSSFVGQLIGLLPNQLQNSLTNTIGNQSLLLMKSSSPSSASKVASTTTVSPFTSTTSTSTTASPSTVVVSSSDSGSSASSAASKTNDSVMPVQFPAASSSDVNKMDEKLTSNSKSTNQSTSDSIQNTTTVAPSTVQVDDQNKAIFEEFFGRQNSPSSINLIMESLRNRLGMGSKGDASSSSDDTSIPSARLHDQTLLDLQQALKHSNGKLSHDEYNEYEQKVKPEVIKTHHLHKEHHVTPVVSSTAKPSLVEKLAALARFTTTTTHSPILVQFPHNSIDEHSKLIENKLKEKLEHLDKLKELIEEKKKHKTTTEATTTTTTAAYAPNYYSKPSYVNQASYGPQSYKPTAYVNPSGPYRQPISPYNAPKNPYTSYGAGHGDDFRPWGPSAFRPRYENQRNGYQYPIYGY